MGRVLFYRYGVVVRWMIYLFIIPSYQCFIPNEHNFVRVPRHQLWQPAHWISRVHSLPPKHTVLPSSKSLATLSHEANTSYIAELWKRTVLSCLESTRLALAIVACTILSPLPSYAAPPFAVIAEELGYFPVMVPKPGSKTKETILQYVPKRVQRHSTEQAVDLAHFLRTRRDSKVILAGTYWCSHTSRQKELFGLEAWTELNANANSASTNAFSAIRPTGFTYLECAPQGYRGNPTMCANLGVDGYPTWIVTSAATAGTSQRQTLRLSGERPLADIAEVVGFVDKHGRTFDSAVEAFANPPPSIGSAACKN
jgi:hypothetical protein